MYRMTHFLYKGYMCVYMPLYVGTLCMLLNIEYKETGKNI